MDKQQLASEITAAMRAQDKPRLSILRQVKNEVDIKEKEQHRDVTADEVVGALKKVLKQTGETLEGSEKAGTNEERTALLREQVAILEGYLPEQLSGPGLEALVECMLLGGGYAGKRDMGRAIADVVAACGGNCDKAEVARLVGGKLS